MGCCDSKEHNDSSLEGGRADSGAVVPAAAPQAASPPSAAISQVSHTSVEIAEPPVVLTPEEPANEEPVPEQEEPEPAAPAPAVPTAGQLETTTAMHVEAAAQPSAAGAAEAKAEPSTKLSAYDELDALFTQDVMGLDDSADIRLIDAVHVINVAKAGGRFQKRQDLPASAFLKKKPAYTIFVSYGWLDKAHPDPDGWHLGILGPLLDLFVRSAAAANGGAAVAVGFFIDFCCLWQAPRSEAQGASFGRALRNINYLYANRKTYVWAQTKMPPGTARDYWARGWTFFELVVAGIVKDNSMIQGRDPSWSREVTVDCECGTKGLKAFANVRLLDLGKLEPTEHEIKMGKRGKASTIDPTQEADFHRVALSCSGGVRRPPLALDAFSEELGRRSFTNGKSDHDVVVGLYARTIDEVMGAVTELIFRNSFWGDEEAMQLAAVLPRCAKLQSLNLNNNGQITDKGTAAIVANLPPSVTCLSLELTRATFALPPALRPGSLEVASGRKQAEFRVYSAGRRTANTPERIKFVRDFYLS